MYTEINYYISDTTHKLIIDKSMEYFRLEHPDRALELQQFFTEQPPLVLKDFFDQLTTNEANYMLGCLITIYGDKSDQSRAA